MRKPGSLFAVVGLAAALFGTPVSAQSPGASPAPSSSPSAGVPFCSDVPKIDIPADRFRDTPVYIGNELPTDALRRWARQYPGYQDIWIDRDHLGWVVLAFSKDADARQADLEREFPGVGAIAIKVAWTRKDLDSLQQRGSVMSGLVAFVATDIVKGVVILGIGVLDADKVAEIRREFAGRRVCIDAIDPATVPAPGPQPQAGVGWRLLGEEKVGEPYRTGIAADRPSFETLWQQAGMSGRPPVVDFQQEVAIWFGAVYGSSCPGIRLDDVVVDAEAALVHALIVQAEPQVFCTADANGHAYVVALDRDRLPAPPVRLQLQAEDPPMGATEEITLVAADLRVPGSVPVPNEVKTIEPPQDQGLVRSGGIIETGFPDQVLVDARCGVEWLGRLNGVWWRTEVPAGRAAFVPAAWQPAVDADGMLEVTVLLRTADDPAVTDGQPRAEVTANGETVIYHATTEPPPACP